MPSGAKRRKAAKKKKENETHNGNSSKNPQGDEKGSDGGEAGFNSQASEGRRSAEPSDVDSVREVGLESDGDVRIERGLKEGVRSKKKKKSGNGKDKSSSSSSSSSSSEDESRRKKEKAVAPVSEEKPPSNLVDSVDSLLAEVTHTTKDAAVEKSTSMDSEKIAPVEYNEPVVDDVSAETVPLTVSTPPFEYPVISNTVAETALESTAEKLLPSEATVTVTDSVSKKSESPEVSENGKASPSVVESEDKENESEVLPSSDVPPAHISNEVESIRQSESPEYSEREREPLVAPAPRVVEKTSWCGCCGILDVITGNRR